MVSCQMKSEGWLMMEPKDVLAEVVAWEAQLEVLHGRIAHLTGQNQEPFRSDSRWRCSRLFSRRNPKDEVAKPPPLWRGLGLWGP